MTRAVLTALVAAFLLSACLLTRLYSFKQQFCSYRDNFAISTADEFRVQLLNPVLRDSDVVWLAGSEPSSRQQDAGSGQMKWLVDKVLPTGSVVNPDFDQLFMEMDFTAADDNFLLSEVRMDPRFSYIVSPDLMERHAANVCNSSWLVFARSGEIDLSDADLSGQPGRAEIVQYLGQPSAGITPGPEQGPEQRPELGMRYEYRLRGSQRSNPEYSLEFWHDAASGELLRSKVHSIRFHSTTDFVQKKMWVKVR